MFTGHGMQPSSGQPAPATKAQPEATVGSWLGAMHVFRDAGILVALAVPLVLVPSGCRQVERAGAHQDAVISLSQSDRARVQSWVETCRGGGYEAIALVSRDAEDASLAALLGFLDSYDPSADPGPGRAGLAVCTCIVEGVLPCGKVGTRDKRVVIA